MSRVSSLQAKEAISPIKVTLQEVMFERKLNTQDAHTPEEVA
jgi:hypothetical protein